MSQLRPKAGWQVQARGGHQLANVQLHRFEEIAGLAVSFAFSPLTLLSFFSVLFVFHPCLAC
jgi:hypothetical protein